MKHMLKSVPLGRLWPMMEEDVLAYMQLKQDEMFSFIKPNQVTLYIEGAIEIGREAAKLFHYNGDLALLMDRVLKSGAKVTFLDETKRKGRQLVRAQYEKKDALIVIFRPSIAQIESFFQRDGYSVRREDIIALHLCHEWFHHLEETRFGRTDDKLPKPTVRKVGPVMFKQSVEKTREIAAHAFTQRMMDLWWCPLLLDYLINEVERKVKKQSIRDSFYQYKQDYIKAKGETVTVS